MPRSVARWLATGEASAVSGHGHFVRTHILQEQGEVCAICGGPTTWNGQPMRLVLDHVDGDSTNNRRANLRLICPNCDSQLPTFKARNRGRGRAWRRQRYADGKSY
ncbi:HNH endonuclease [Nocardioides seonyuensis]|uniref:HNH endonuclease signature motif containing protein n=1 Tax=Nocardioides seonyuensis TaxID=2518371 RepID=UPI001ABE5096|nr:HNH endonuclease [Nocardioides seonyuensis]